MAASRSVDPQAQRDFAVEVVKKLREAGFIALWAGGCVRDSLLGKMPDDYDVATNARPEQVQEVFGKRRTLAIGASFGVIMVLGPKGGRTGQVEVATCRPEGPYHDGRRPEHVSFSTPEEDAQRRDFTINGMFFDPIAEQVHDYVGGQRDLQAKLLRAIGEPLQRFREDKLRMLRAVRMASRFEFELDAETGYAIREMASEILIVSHERIAQELKKMLQNRHRARAIELARELGLLQLIFPELVPVWTGYHHEAAAGAVSPRWKKTLRMLELLEEPSFELAMATLFHEFSPRPEQDLAADADPAQTVAAVESLCRRLKLSNNECEQVGWLLTHQHAVRGYERQSLSQIKRLLAEPFVRELLDLNRVEALAEGNSSGAVEFFEEKLRMWSASDINPPTLISGDDLIRHGLKPGIEFKSLLEQIRDAQLEGRVNDKPSALELVDRLRGKSRDDTTGSS